MKNFSWNHIQAIGKMQTNLSSFPFDFSWFGNRISALIYIKFFGEGFVLKVRILVKILQKRKHICVTSVSEYGMTFRMYKYQVSQTTHKIYSISRLDILKLSDLHPRQVMKCFLVLLPQKSWNYRSDTQVCLWKIHQHNIFFFFLNKAAVNKLRQWLFTPLIIILVASKVSRHTYL